MVASSRKTVLAKVLIHNSRADLGEIPAALADVVSAVVYSECVCPVLSSGPGYQWRQVVTLCGSVTAAL